MKFLVEKRELLKGLTLANSVVERASTIPILANVLLVAAEGALTVVATDLDVQIKL
ncbi:MAG: DNA polymerase III subunit beta, partial [Bacteroidota bacterium]